MSRPGGFEPRRIVVVVTRQIGDVLLTTPLISAAKARWPNAAIDVLGMAGTLDVLAGHPAVSSCIDVGAIRSWRDGSRSYAGCGAAATSRSSARRATARISPA